MNSCASRWLVLSAPFHNDIPDHIGSRPDSTDGPPLRLCSPRETEGKSISGEAQGWVTACRLQRGSLDPILQEQNQLPGSPEEQTGSREASPRRLLGIGAMGELSCLGEGLRGDPRTTFERYAWGVGKRESIFQPRMSKDVCGSGTPSAPKGVKLLLSVALPNAHQCVLMST